MGVCKRVVILVPEGPSILSSIVGTHHVFTQASDLVEKQCGSAVFSVQLVGLSEEVKLENGLYSVHPDIHVAECAGADLIIIPALHDSIETLERNEEFIPWIREQYQQGAELASLCTGAFLLAASGLLNGRRCTTHWASADKFRRMFPAVELVAETIITDERGIYSSGGAYSFLRLILYLIEKYCGRDVAITCSKVFEIDLDRSCQSPFIIFIGEKEHEDEEIKQAQVFMETNVGDKISVDRLAGMVALSRRNFERRFKKATTHTPVEYLQRVKMEAAKKGLEAGRATVSDVMYAVGYSDSKAFRSIFKKITGLSPMEYRNKYNREIAV